MFVVLFIRSSIEQVDDALNSTRKKIRFILVLCSCSEKCALWQINMNNSKNPLTVQLFKVTVGCLPYSYYLYQDSADKHSLTWSAQHVTGRFVTCLFQTLAKHNQMCSEVLFRVVIHML